MNKFIFFAALTTFITVLPTHAQVTGMYTDYNGFWASSSTTINSVKPDDHHLLLGFTFNGTTYSTGIDDGILSSNGVTFDDQTFRALPITTVPTSGDEYYLIGYGQLSDGIDDGTDDSSTTPFPANPGVAKLASFLTDGKKGLDISTCLANIPEQSDLTLELSDNGITLASIGDGVPDLLATQVANVNNTVDVLKFVDGSGNTVGNSVSINLTNAANYPIVGNWLGDFYMFNSVGADPKEDYIKVEKQYRLFAAELSDFGITSANYQDAVALVFTFGGSSDTAFIAYNEPSIGVASKIGFVGPTITTDCDGNISNITVQLQDSFSDPVNQANFVVTATITTGPGQLLGTLSKTTNSSGQAVFDDLAFEVGGDHKITFSTSSLAPGTTSLIAPATNCNPSGELVWDGSTSTEWSDPTNWTTNIVPNANFDVIIPSGMPNYPVLDVDTGAKNLEMDAGSSIDLNGHLFTIAGQISVVGGSPFIEGASEGSELFMSGTAAQVVPANFLSGNFDKFTVENASGVEMDADLGVTGVLNVISGTFTTNGNVTLVCDFGPNGGTGQIAELTGSISGNVTAEQCFPARRAFRFVSSSVNTNTSIRINWQENAADYLDSDPAGYGTHITGVDGSPDGTNGFDWSESGNPSMFLFSNTSSTWSAIPNTDATNLSAGTPYRLMIRGDRTIDITDNATNPTNTKLRATGTVEKGPVTMDNFNDQQGYFNFFGNPFHAAVDMNKVLIRGTNVNPNYYYIWDPTLGGTPTPTLEDGTITAGGRGAYVTVDLTVGGGTTIQGGASGTTYANKYLQPYQAAFFETGSGGGTPEITFLESDKNTDVDQTAVFRTNSDPVYRNSYIMVNLFTQANYFTANSTASDGLKIKFIESGNNGVDMKDAPKLGNLDENLARAIETGYYSIETRNMPANEEILPLFLNQYRFTDYTFLIETNDIPENVTAYLQDAYLDTESVFNANSLTTINFEIDPSIPASIAPDRFSIVFDVSELNVDSAETSVFALYPNPTVNGNFFVSLPNSAGDKVQINLYNILGQKVYAQEKTMDPANRTNINAGYLNAGVYMVEFVHNGKSNTQKLIVK